MESLSPIQFVSMSLPRSDSETFQRAIIDRTAP